MLVKPDLKDELIMMRLPIIFVPVLFKILASFVSIFFLQMRIAMIGGGRLNI